MNPDFMSTISMGIGVISQIFSMGTGVAQQSMMYRQQQQQMAQQQAQMQQQQCPPPGRLETIVGADGKPQLICILGQQP